MKLSVILSLVGVLFCGLSAEAQILTGSMIGVVRDESRAVLPGVTAVVTSPALPGGPATVVTNAQGEYRFAGLQPGVYELTLSLTGFTTYVERDLRVAVGGTIERDVNLTVASIAESITVSGQTPVVDPRQTGIVKSLSAEVVEAVPQNRQGGIMAYMATLPGVTPANYNRIGGVNVMGSNQNETSYVIDGITLNHVMSGGSYGYFDQDNIEEMNVVSLGASAEYQQAQGGVMNVVTKAGVNRWRGDAVIYWAPPELTSAPFTLPCNCSEGETGFKLYKYRDYGVHAGGPIKKDRFWYYGGVSDAGPSFRNPGQPDQPDEFKWIRYEARSNHKLTVRLTDKVMFNQTIYYEWWDWSNPDFPTFTNPLETIQWYSGDIRASGSQLTATLSSSTVLTARYNINAMPYGDIGFGANLKHDSESLKSAPHLDTFTGLSSGNTTSAPADAYDPRRDEANIKLNQYFSGRRLKHNVRYGVQWARNRLSAANVWPENVLYQDLNGAPDQAQFQPPSVYAALYNQWSAWGEDEINVGRVTILPGVRFDRMVATSPAAPEIDPTTSIGDAGLCRCVIAFPKTGTTVAGLGDMFTWVKVAPRIGLNMKLTADGRTVLRATAGRYYRPVFLNDVTGVHPGLAPVTLGKYDPATRTYTTISVTDAKRNLAVDPDVNPPYTDQLSIGVDREIARNLGVSATYVHKESHDEIGWDDVGGVYATRTVTAPNGRPVDVLALMNSPSERKFLRTNGPGMFARYNGIVLSLNRRYANRWTANFGYTYSRSEGLEINPGSAAIAGTGGQDPNDYINFTGRLSPNDRPHVFNATGTYEVPKIGVQVSGNLTLAQGIPYGAQFQVNLPQGRRSIYFDAPGAYRTPNQQWLHFRANKILFRDGPRYLEVGVELRNALQERSIDSITTRLFTSPNFGLPNAWAIPRQLMFRVRGYF